LKRKYFKSDKIMHIKPRISEILFATDLSENANRAMEYAASLAEAYRARITVLHVIEKVPPNSEMLMTAILGYDNINEYRQKDEEELTKEIKGYLERFCTRIADQVEVECRLMFKSILVEPGNAAERIIYHTMTGRYDVLVIGTRGHGLLEEALMGGTSRKVLQGCRIPLLFIPYD
jgi:nucleotide-binding universal stress UspA family protein